MTVALVMSDAPNNTVTEQLAIADHSSPSSLSLHSVSLSIQLWSPTDD